MPARGEPGFEARELLNNAVGGLFTSRLNANLREKNGYTYGVRSILFATNELGGLLVMTAVRSDVTADALEQIFVELQAVGDGSRPLGADEIDRSRADLVEHVGATLERTHALIGNLQDIVLHRLSPSYFTEYGKTLHALDGESVAGEAKRMTPARMAVVVVGDRSAIEPALEKKGFRVTPAAPSLVE
jgi:zinc protease